VAKHWSNIFGLGGVTLDEVHSVIGRVEPDEVCYIQKTHRKVGGMTATALITAARLGANVTFAGAIGDDDKGIRIRDMLEVERIDTTFVSVIPETESSFSVVLNALQHGYRTIANQKGVQVQNRLPFDVTTAIRSASCCHLDGFWIESAIEAAQFAIDNGVPVTLDVSQNQNDPRFERLIGMADYFIPSKAAALRISGVNDLREMAHSILSFGCGTVVITLGGEGVYAMDQTGNALSLPAFDVKVNDTNGAGDSFHGAFAFGVAQGWNLPKLLEFSSAVAAIKCSSQAPGNEGLPDLQAVYSFLEEKGAVDETDALSR